MENRVVLSVVLPCLDEARTLGRCIASVRRALAPMNVAAEIVVADNGSHDDSVAIAAAAGAVVVSEPVRGYGRAVRAGIEAARGRYVIMMDSDLSYDAAAIPMLLDHLMDGAELVVASRLSAPVEPGAMPFLHRYVGTPVLSLVMRLLFDSTVRDINSGMRGLTREAYQRLALRTDGMELASEMLVSATAHKMRIREVPVRFFRDQRGRPGHLRPLRDGMRHLLLLLRLAFANGSTGHGTGRR